MRMFSNVKLFIPGTFGAFCPLWPTIAKKKHSNYLHYGMTYVYTLTEKSFWNEGEVHEHYDLFNWISSLWTTSYAGEDWGLISGCALAPMPATAHNVSYALWCSKFDPLHWSAQMNTNIQSYRWLFCCRDMKSFTILRIRYHRACIIHDRHWMKRSSGDQWLWRHDMDTPSTLRLWGETTSHRWILLAKGAGSPHNTINAEISWFILNICWTNSPVACDCMTPMWRLCNVTSHAQSYIYDTIQL